MQTIWDTLYDCIMYVYVLYKRMEKMNYACRSSKVQDQIGRFFFLLAKLAISLQEKQEEGVVGRFLHFFGRPKLYTSAQRSSPTENGFSKFWGH